MKKHQFTWLVAASLLFASSTTAFCYEFGKGPWEGKRCKVLVKNKKGKKVPCDAPYLHTGVDLSATKNKAVYYNKGGYVKKVHPGGKWKTAVVIETLSGKTFTIWHLDRVQVREGTYYKPDASYLLGYVADLSGAPDHIHLSQRNAFYDSSSSGAKSLAGRLRSCDHSDMDDSRLPKFKDKFVQPDESAITILK